LYHKIKIFFTKLVNNLKLALNKVNLESFEKLALAIFQFQYLNCEPYQLYIKNLNIDPKSINQINKIPFLPISFFKTQKVLSKTENYEAIFESSGTTGFNTSRHYVSDTNFYNIHSQKLFENIYGQLTDFHIIALLPSYLEKGNSSLVHMISHFIKQSDSLYSGFFLSDYQKIIDTFNNIKKNNNPKRKILLWGVTYALLDLLEMGYDFNDFKNELIVLETGGMKGRRKEMIREELYEKLKSGYSVNNIHSEYGMTELLSQAYSQQDAIFQCPSTMKIVIREVNDPFEIIGPNNLSKTGGINVIDLANIDSCSFIETQDLGQYVDESGKFRVLGRFDNSDIRGCNLLVN
jgi:Acyl-protein synthetase, LuxE